MEQDTMQAEASTVQESAATYAVTTEQPSLEYVLALASRLALTEQLRMIQFLVERLSMSPLQKGQFHRGGAEGAEFRGEIQERNPFLSEFISVYQWLK